MSDQFDDDRRSSPPQEDEVCDPQVDRDGKGRFRSCGNKRGRPKKQKPQTPASMAEAIVNALDERLPITSKGKSVTISVVEIIAKKLIHDLLNGTPADRIRGLRALERLGVLQMLAAMKAAENGGDVWTDELEAKYRIVMSEYDDVDDGSEPSGSSDG